MTFRRVVPGVGRVLTLRRAVSEIKGLLHLRMLISGDKRVDSVKAGFQSYSSVLQQSTTSRADSVTSKEALKSVVKDVVNEASLRRIKKN